MESDASTTAGLRVHPERGSSHIHTLRETEKNEANPSFARLDLEAVTNDSKTSVVAGPSKTPKDSQPKTVTPNTQTANVNPVPGTIEDQGTQTSSGGPHHHHHNNAQTPQDVISV